MCVMRHQPQSGRHSNCKDAYQSWYHAHLEQLAQQFDVSLEINDNKWLPSMKAKLEKHWHAAYQQHMQNNASMWAKVYTAFKQQPTVEPYMLSLVHPVSISLHKLRSSHFPLQRSINKVNNTDTTCTLCHAAEEDMPHFLLHCTAYRHRRSLQKQIDHVKQFYAVQYQQEVDMYFDNDLPDIQRCAHLLSRSLPTAPQQQIQRNKWRVMWYTIFHKLDIHLYIIVQQREAVMSTLYLG